VKKIIVTQRVDVIVDYRERRDAIDQRWLGFLLSINIFPILVPNSLDYIKQVIITEDIDGILFTGGNSLVSYGGDAPERDEVEIFLLEWAIKKNIPVLGVCRGMQLIQHYFNNQLVPISDHVATRHKLQIEKGKRLSPILDNMYDVNAFHLLGTHKVTGELELVAKSVDGVVMAVEHKQYDIFGIMWHSERENPYLVKDIELYKEIYFRGI